MQPQFYSTPSMPLEYTFPFTIKESKSVSQSHREYLQNKFPELKEKAAILRVCNENWYYGDSFIFLACSGCGIAFGPIEDTYKKYNL